MLTAARAPRANLPRGGSRPIVWEVSHVDKLFRPTKIALVVIAALAIMLGVTAPSQAAGVGGHGFGSGHDVGGAMHHGFEGHHFDGHHFDGRVHDRFRFGFAPVFPYYPYEPYSSYEAPGYWYYCPSYGAYYPSVTSCPDAWVAVPPS
jgi:hypothetical protein